jgi:hypothetical protein
MTEVDFSKWVGKPPRDGAIHESEERGEGEEDEKATSLHRKTDSDSSQPESVSDKDNDASPGTKSRSNTNSTPNSPSPSHQTQLVNGFYIDIPKLAEESEYEHLPGYFAVQKIIREVKPGRYLVRLRSGETDLVSLN